MYVYGTIQCIVELFGKLEKATGIDKLYPSHSPLSTHSDISGKNLL